VTSALRISEAASLALHTSVLLAAEGGRLSTRQIADRLGVSEAHLAKVMQRLAKAGLVASVRGRHGGFSLARRKDRIRLIDVYQAIEGRLPRSQCLMGRPVCGGKRCLLGGLLETVDVWLRSYLAGTTLSQLTDVYAGSRAAPEQTDGSGGTDACA